MPLFINTNISSLYAQRAAQKASDKLDISYQRLSSGMRINSAKDDAAGIQVANNLTTQLNGLDQGNRNAQDAIAFAQTVEGALDEVTNMLQRLRTLAVQSATGTMTDSDRQGIQAEVDALTEEIERIANETTFGGADILNGNASIVRFQVGPDPSSIIEMDLTYAMDVDGLAGLAAKYAGAQSYELYTTSDGNAVMANYADIFSNRDSDDPGIDLSSPSAAQAVLAGIDDLITAVDRKRADLGAMQNRLEATVRNQENVEENVFSARATLRDTDWAEETATLTQQDIIQQATATILVQANQRPQIALSMLQS
ncbi:MAG: flagellin [Candidatus Anaerobiospirillum pullicola]|uniref:Flagellin n=1 Tax=Candidatus Anaerobiospirillum pullicola TaxID=2838451 RepID=A0A948WZV2_9GAMM|nr:flagellin [Candidatus Anaerobiospirillum pullicola]